MDFQFEIEAFPALFVATKAGIFKQEVKTSAAMFLATEAGILCQNMIFFFPLPSGFCALT